MHVQMHRLTRPGRTLMRLRHPSARILLDLLDEDAVRGAVGSIGLGPGAGWAEAEDKASAGILRRLSAGLADLAWQNGRAIRVGFQPEPGCVLDTAEQTVAALSRVD